MDIVSYRSIDHFQYEKSISLQIIVKFVHIVDYKEILLHFFSKLNLSLCPSCFFLIYLINAHFRKWKDLLMCQLQVYLKCLIRPSQVNFSSARWLFYVIRAQIKFFIMCNDFFLKLYRECVLLCLFVYPVALKVIVFAPALGR